MCRELFVTKIARIQDDVFLVQLFRELKIVSIGVRSSQRPVKTFAALVEMCQLLVAVCNVHSSPVRYEACVLSFVLFT